MHKRLCVDKAEALLESRTKLEKQLTDEQWFLMANLFPTQPPSAKGGRPRADTRDCVEGILWR